MSHWSSVPCICPQPKSGFFKLRLNLMPIMLILKTFHIVTNIFVCYIFFVQSHVCDSTLQSSKLFEQGRGGGGGHAKHMPSVQQNEFSLTDSTKMLVMTTEKKGPMLNFCSLRWMNQHTHCGAIAKTNWQLMCSCVHLFICSRVWSIHSAFGSCSNQQPQRSIHEKTECDSHSKTDALAWWALNQSSVTDWGDSPNQIARMMNDAALHWQLSCMSQRNEPLQ